MLIIKADFYSDVIINISIIQGRIFATKSLRYGKEVHLTWSLFEFFIIFGINEHVTPFTSYFYSSRNFFSKRNNTVSVPNKIFPLVWKHSLSELIHYIVLIIVSTFYHLYIGKLRGIRFKAHKIWKIINPKTISEYLIMSLLHQCSNYKSLIIWLHRLHRNIFGRGGTLKKQSKKNTSTVFVIFHKQYTMPATTNSIIFHL